jgi:hypothetical protein
MKYIVYVSEPVTHNDHQYWVRIADETEAFSEEEALQNVLFRKYAGKWPISRITYVFDELKRRGAYEAYAMDMAKPLKKVKRMKPSIKPDSEQLHLDFESDVQAIKAVLSGKCGSGSYDYEGIEMAPPVSQVQETVDVLNESVPDVIATIKQGFEWEYDLRQPPNTDDLGLRLRDYEIPTNKQNRGLKHPEFYNKDFEKEPDY